MLPFFPLLACFTLTRQEQKQWGVCLLIWLNFFVQREVLPLILFLSIMFPEWVILIQSNIEHSEFRQQDRFILLIKWHGDVRHNFISQSFWLKSACFILYFSAFGSGLVCSIYVTCMLHSLFFSDV